MLSKEPLELGNDSITSCRRGFPNCVVRNTARPFVVEGDESLGFSITCYSLLLREFETSQSALREGTATPDLPREPGIW